MRVSSQARQLSSPDMRGVPVDCEGCEAKIQAGNGKYCEYTSRCPTRGWCCKMVLKNHMLKMNGNKVANLATPKKGVELPANILSGHQECLRWYPDIKAK